VTELSVQLESDGPIIKPCENRTNVIDSPSLCGISKQSVKSAQTYFCEIDQLLSDQVLIFGEVCSNGVPNDDIVQDEPYRVIEAR